MTSCDYLLPLLQPLQCDFPACNCEKCQQLRSEGRYDQDNSAKQLEIEKKDIEETECLGHSQGDVISPLATDGVSQAVTPAALFSRFNYNFQPENIYSVLFDVIGTIAFVVMATFTFWFVITIYIWRFVLSIYYAGRKPQVITLVLCCLLSMCIIFHAISDHKMKRLQKENAINFSHESSPSADVPTSLEASKKVDDNSVSNASFKERPCKRKCSHQTLSSSSLTSSSSSECNLKSQNSGHPKNSQPRESGGSTTGKDCDNLRKEASESLCDLCAKKFKKSGSKTFISDEDARNIFNTYQLCAIPMDWKSPPTPIVFIVDYIKKLFSDSTTSTTDG